MCHWLRDITSSSDVFSFEYTPFFCLNQQVLKLSPGTSQEEITATYKRLVKEWHPDKIKDPEMRKFAEVCLYFLEQVLHAQPSSSNGRRKQ